MRYLSVCILLCLCTHTQALHRRHWPDFSSELLLQYVQQGYQCLGQLHRHQLLDSTFAPVSWLLWDWIYYTGSLMPSTPNSVSKSIMFLGCPSTAFVHLFVRTDLVTMISHKQLKQSRLTCVEYSLAHTDDLLDSGGPNHNHKHIYIVPLCGGFNGQGHSRPWQRHLRQRWVIEVHLLIFM